MSFGSKKSGFVWGDVSDDDDHDAVVPIIVQVCVPILQLKPFQVVLPAAVLPAAVLPVAIDGDDGFAKVQSRRTRQVMKKTLKPTVTPTCHMSVVDESPVGNTYPKQVVLVRDPERRQPRTKPLTVVLKTTTIKSPAIKVTKTADTNPTRFSRDHTVQKKVPEKLTNNDLGRSALEVLKGCAAECSYDDMLASVRGYYNNKISFRAAKAIVYLWQDWSDELEKLTSDAVVDFLFDKIAMADLTRHFDWNESVGKGMDWFLHHIDAFLQSNKIATT